VSGRIDPDVLRRLWAEGVPSAEIAARFGVRYPAVNRAAKALGLTPRRAGRKAAPAPDAHRLKSRRAGSLLPGFKPAPGGSAAIPAPLSATVPPAAALPEVFPPLSDAWWRPGPQFDAGLVAACRAAAAAMLARVRGRTEREDDRVVLDWIGFRVAGLSAREIAAMWAVDVGVVRNALGWVVRDDLLHSGEPRGRVRAAYTWEAA